MSNTEEQYFKPIGWSILAFLMGLACGLLEAQNEPFPDHAIEALKWQLTNALRDAGIPE